LAKERLRQQLREQLSTLQGSRTKLLQRLSELWDERFAIRESVAERINTALSPTIRVSVQQFGNPELYRQLLEEALKSARIKHLIVAQKIAGKFWPVALATAIRERKTAALIDRAELNPEQAEKALVALSNPKLLFELETVELLDLPRIELKDGDTYKDSLSLSTGQKCTAILPILLLDSANPLLIDQPEDNLDNRFIFETVVDSIRKVKTGRQLIFVTHNPNIPVLGDAERVFVLDSDGSAARMANEGTVDECKSEIVTLLEGGEDAFKARKYRYAY
jgi:ABC-type dipeptide/oligopeptide/nickel transport system ATPase component